jgi:hypothetical protein
MAGLSALIVAVVIWVSYVYGGDIYKESERNLDYLIPFGTCLAGVLLYVMSVIRQKGSAWKLRNFWGDYCYRVAQAFAYLFIVLWAWSSVSGTPGVNGGVSVTSVPPNILGFLVGFFILRVERAMESLGEKFEEVLMSIFPRSLNYITIQEKRRQEMKDKFKLEDMKTQYEALRPMIENEAARQKIEEGLQEALEAAGKDDSEEAKKKIDRVARTMDDARQAMNESLVPLDDLIRVPQHGGKSY